MYALQMLICLIVCAILNGHPSVYWIGNGGTCAKSYGTFYYCIHCTNCLYPNIYGQYGGRPEFCGYEDLTTEVYCCVKNEKLEHNCENSFPYPTSENEFEEFVLNPDNSQEVSDDRQLGGGGGGENNGAATQGDTFDLSQIIKNLNISFPFYKPTPKNSTSFKKCQDNVSQQFVVGGTDAKPREFPHMALLGYGDENNIQWSCGGSLISEQYVLTAAHCLFLRNFGEVKYVVLGVVDIRNLTQDNEIKHFGVEMTIRHPLFKSREKYHDIALIKLNKVVSTSPFIRPACLATTWDLQNIPLSVTGWGLTEYLGEPANILQAANLQYVESQQCRRIYGTSTALPGGVIELLHICAWGGQRIDACQGDSGGPLQFSNTNSGYNKFVEVAGIVSHGIRCGITAGVYTRVLPYVPWIESIVWPNE